MDAPLAEDLTALEYLYPVPDLVTLTQATGNPAWQHRHSEAIALLRHSIAVEASDLAPVSVALREMRQPS